MPIVCTAIVQPVAHSLVRTPLLRYLYDARGRLFAPSPVCRRHRRPGVADWRRFAALRQTRAAVALPVVPVWCVRALARRRSRTRRGVAAHVGDVRLALLRALPLEEARASTNRPTHTPVSARCVCAACATFAVARLAPEHSATSTFFVFFFWHCRDDRTLLFLFRHCV